MRPYIRNFIPKDKVSAFMKLIDAMAARLGCHERACKYIGLSSGHVHRIRAGVTELTEPTAHKIMAGYKRFKAEHGQS